MKEMKKNEELQSRREFFKKAAKSALPILVMCTVGGALLSSCEKDDESSKDDVDRNGCKNCGLSCNNDCFKSCRGSCEDTCSGSSKW